MPGILTADLWPEVPPWPTKNYAELALERPEFQALDDYTLQIDGVTGKKRKFREFLDRVADAATALGAGGLGLTADHGFVGLMSENCMVCTFPLMQSYTRLKLVLGLSGHCLRPVQDRSSLQPHSIPGHAGRIQYTVETIGCTHALCQPTSTACCSGGSQGNRSTRKQDFHSGRTCCWADKFF